ncbi:thioesterase family protein [Acuticoccus sp. I52.16.1]|uniref:acyl-CoA thioesterase n=1 Tax=Acuticoccus sp. I52.16.1 TaxID=2928472 RepID=UPI001FD0EC1D|nr:thioesterase family protein [Acuticoccus sp. I52.16.1]UOM33228.1 acyl-CoA thioesterase [Acuticoccus sp. I52.16.1]
MRPPPSRLSDYVLSETFTTRWADNDIYGHINNAAYYGFIDTAVNRFMIAKAGIDIHSGPVIALVVETGCRYHAPIAFPQDVVVALKVVRLGNSSVTWHAGLFESPASPGDTAAAEAHFTHVLVDREQRRPIAWPDQLRNALTSAMGQARTDEPTA